MNVAQIIQSRSGNACEFCKATENLEVYTVPPSKGELTAQNSVLMCTNCQVQVTGEKEMDANHWRCLNDSMWSEFLPVKVLSWRMLHRLKAEGWSQDLLDMMYLDESALAWAKETGEDEEEEDKIIHKDSNGVVLEAGDSVVLIKDLPVKGSSMVAKRGTAVRRISLDRDNAEYIEGKVDGQHIVIITKYVKKL